jgi:hypothetical protein
MKRLLVVVLAASVLGSMAFAQGLPRGATAWEYATLLRERSGYDFAFEWYSRAVPAGIASGSPDFYVAFAEAHGINYERVKEELPGGVAYMLNLAGMAGWEVVTYLDLGSGEYEVLFKRPRP